MNILENIPAHFQSVIFLSVSGLLIRTSLVMSGQTWARSYHHLATYILLPNITYVITSTIANNIALSLGMIGALSIVRFRNPVKSHFELTIFFALITLGIAASVTLQYAGLLIGIILITIFGIEFFQLILKKFNLSFYQLSFTEGETKNIIEIESKKSIIFIEKSEYLVSSYFSENTKTWDYKLAFKNREDVVKFTELLSKSDDIISVRKLLNN